MSIVLYVLFVMRLESGIFIPAVLYPGKYLLGEK